MTPTERLTRAVQTIRGLHEPTEFPAGAEELYSGDYEYTRGQIEFIMDEIGFPPGFDEDSDGARGELVRLVREGWAV